MKGCMSTDLGIITIDPEVIAKYAGTVAVECWNRWNGCSEYEGWSGSSVKKREPDSWN